MNFCIMYVKYTAFIFAATSLHDFSVLVGNNIADPTSPDLAAYQLCATYSGIAPAGAVDVPCSAPAIGNFLAVQIVGANETLQMCEVVVYTDIGMMLDDHYSHHYLYVLLHLL